MQAVQAVLSTLFIPSCAACEAHVPLTTPLCPPCSISLDPVGPACPRCAEPQVAEPANVCARCRTEAWPLEHLIAPWRYGGELGRALRRLKFAPRPHLARELAPLAAPFLAAAVAHAGIDVIVPIPLHWRRLASRGFNQAEALARHARNHAALTTPIDTRARARLRATAPQTHLDAAARRVNLEGALAVRRPARVAGRRVLVVDDIVTTGATMAAAGHALRAAGAAAVIGFAFARAER